VPDLSPPQPNPPRPNLPVISERLNTYGNVYPYDVKELIDYIVYLEALAIAAGVVQDEDVAGSMP
jgi:hypothetical protein